MTEIDAGHETPEAKRLLGFFHAIFSSENKKMHLPIFAVQAGSELKNHIFWGAEFSHFREGSAPFFTPKNVKCLCLKRAWQVL